VSNLDLLLLGGPDQTAVVARQAQANVVHYDDAYDALLELSRRPWPAVVLTAGREDFAGLCRACRRLQPHARLLVLCSPAQEAAIRPLRPALLDDYFVYPTTRDDWALLRGPFVAQASGGELCALTPADFSALAGAARSLPALESQLASLVSVRLRRTVRWVPREAVAPGQSGLLDIPGQAKMLVVGKDEAGDLSPHQRDMLANLAHALPGLVQAAMRAQSLHRLASTDHLTGVYNRRYFCQLTDQILLRAVRRHFRVTLLLYDMDNFKRYNDTYGHQAGDEILRETAQLMRRTTRRQDIVARIGGDEFAVLFWDAEKPRQPNSRHPDTPYVLADRFRQAVLQHEFRLLGSEAKGSLTISGGLARFPVDGTNCDELLRRADQALHEAKALGKNVIHLIGQKR